MKSFKAIAAMSLNRVIGRGREIPWRLPEDFKWFKRMTTGKVIVMGRKTFEAIGQALPNRTTIVLSRRPFQHPGVQSARGLGEIEPGRENREVFICGGAEIYAQALPLCSDLFLTVVKQVVEGDVFFPPFEEQFELVETLRDTPEFRILHYRRRQNPPLLSPGVMVDSPVAMAQPLSELNVKLFADGADKKSMLELYANPLIKGLTTNPTLMRKAGISDYEAYARDVLQTVRDKPISFEVFSDEFPEMRRQALKIAAWQKNVYVKIPITNTRRESSGALIRELALAGVQVNVTAILTLSQVRAVAEALQPAVPSVVSVFAGRIADTGRDPAPMMRAALALLEGQPKTELLWASVREVLNIWQAEACGCQIVTVPHDVLAKALKMGGMDLANLSLDTVKMFAADAASAGYSL
jgi:transaldolase